MTEFVNVDFTSVVSPRCPLPHQIRGHYPESYRSLRTDCLSLAVSADENGQHGCPFNVEFWNIRQIFVSHLSVQTGPETHDSLGQRGKPFWHLCVGRISCSFNVDSWWCRTVAAILREELLGAVKRLSRQNQIRNFVLTKKVNKISNSNRGCTKITYSLRKFRPFNQFISTLHFLDVVPP